MPSLNKRSEPVMGFSQEWDAIYRSNAQITEWPFSDMVSYVMRYARPMGTGYRVLELGCGAGAHIPFFGSLGVQYFGIEGSAAVVERLHIKYPALHDSVVVEDFTRSIPFASSFDLVVDRSSLTHNATADMRRALKLVSDKLVRGGMFVGIDWFSIDHSDYKNGEAAEDAFTRRDYKEGQFAGVGRVHFSSNEHLRELFSSFVIERLEHKVITRKIPSGDHVYALWNIAARKK